MAGTVKKSAGGGVEKASPPDRAKELREPRHLCGICHHSFAASWLLENHVNKVHYDSRRKD